MSEFKSYHPIVNFTYFFFAIAFTCVFLHPITLAVSLAVGIIHLVILKGSAEARKRAKYLLPMFFLTAVINPAFNHAGITILTYLPSGNPLTLESILYGAVAAGMIIGVLLQCSCYNEIMTADKHVYLFGRVIPVLSLLFSMVLQFVPKLTERIKIVADAQKSLGRDVARGGIITRIKNGLKILSVVTTWSIESAVETADSMRSRGYGLSGRTAFSIFTFSARDGRTLTAILVLGVYVLIGGFFGAVRFECFPTVQLAELTPLSISVFAYQALLLAVPIIIEAWEVRKWAVIKSKI